MKLEKLDGMQWKELVSFMETDYLPLALETTPHESNVAEVAHNSGAEAGAGVAIAYRHLEVYGHKVTAWTGVSIYYHLLPVYNDIHRVAENLCWSSSPNKHEFKDTEWPIEPMKFNKKNKHKWGGLANVMLSISAAEFMDDNTCSKLAAFAIHDFLEQGMKRKKKG